MNKLNKEQEFFHEISPQVLNYATTASRAIEVLKVNTPVKVEFATKADIEVETMITDEIKKRFPKDNIIAEESSPDIPKSFNGRYWIIDPICGTTNFSRGTNLFATNIALAENGKLIAGCVLDHMEGVYIWSIKGNKVFRGSEQISDPSNIEPPYIIEFDFPAVNTLKDNEKTKYSKFIQRITNNTSYYIASYATSLAYTYTALNKIDCFIVPRARAWDIAAPIFLTMQAGGIVTQLDGSPWTLTAKNVVGSNNKNLHKKILELLNPSQPPSL